MVEKENVCVEEKGAEQAVITAEGMKERESCPNLGSAAPKKFKDADALARAYGALEAEFTRRSQRIKELEKEVEKWKSGFGDLENSGAEKLRKNAESRRNAAREFDKFIKGLGKAGETSQKQEETTAKQAEKRALDAEAIEEGFADTEKEKENVQTLVSAEKGAEEAEKVLTTEDLGGVGEKVKAALQESEAVSSVVGEREALSSDELYARVCDNEQVRLKIIGEYLSSVGKNLPPLTAGGVGAMLAPPMRAKSIADAGSYALQYFKKPFEA